jgi:Flagellar motor switch protein
VLDQSPGDPIVVKVGKIPKFVARPGTHRGRLAVQIEARVKGEDADD